MSKNERKPLIVYVPTRSAYFGSDASLEEEIEHAKELIYLRLTGRQVAGVLFLTESKMLRKDWKGDFLYPEYLVINLEENTYTKVKQ